MLPVTRTPSLLGFPPLPLPLAARVGSDALIITLPRVVMGSTDPAGFTGPAGSTVLSGSTDPVAFALPVSGFLARLLLAWLLLARLSRCGDLLLLRLERNACSISLAGYPDQSVFFSEWRTVPSFFLSTASRKKNGHEALHFSRDSGPPTKKNKKQKTKNKKQKTKNKKQKTKNKKKRHDAKTITAGISGFSSGVSYSTLAVFVCAAEASEGGR